MLHRHAAHGEAVAQIGWRHRTPDCGDHRRGRRRETVAVRAALAGLDNRTSSGTSRTGPSHTRPVGAINGVAIGIFSGGQHLGFNRCLDLGGEHSNVGKLVRTS